MTPRLVLAEKPPALPRLVDYQDARYADRYLDLLRPFVDGDAGTEHWFGYPNFYVITRYNRSPMYAMAVHDLGQAVVNFMRDATR